MELELPIETNGILSQEFNLCPLVYATAAIQQSGVSLDQNRFPFVRFCSLSSLPRPNTSDLPSAQVNWQKWYRYSYHELVSVLYYED